MAYKETLEKAKTKASEMVVKALEKGEAVWTKPWIFQAAHHGFMGNPYRGQNIYTAEAARIVLGHGSNAWLTWGKYQELRKKDDTIWMKPGSKSVLITCWLPKEKKDKDGNVVVNSKGNPVMTFWPKNHLVFNADCFENLDVDKYEKKPLLEEKAVMTFEENKARLLSLYKDAPEVHYKDLGRAFYSPSCDEVVIPQPKHFRSEAAAYSTLCHELVHSTGAEGRLKRKITNTFGDDDYSYEELVAEIGATILSAEAGYLEETVENSAAYLQGWSKRLTDNPHWFWDAYSDAKKACDYILGVVHESDDEDENEAEADDEQKAVQMIA